MARLTNKARLSQPDMDPQRTYMAEGLQPCFYYLRSHNVDGVAVEITGHAFSPAANLHPRGLREGVSFKGGDIRHKIGA